ncbi:MAG: phospholipase D-like domain-containing protein [Alphaproteobacteria bacterium]
MSAIEMGDRGRGEQAGAGMREAPAAGARRPDAGDAHRRYQLERLLGARFVAGNRIERLRNGDEIFPAMLAAIRGAERCIDFLIFNFMAGPLAERFADAFAERARDGVAVRLLIDAFGGGLMPRRLVRQMRDAGVDVAWFRPPRPWRPFKAAHRTHRKVMVVDNAVGFTGGVGIAELWTGYARNPSEWRDSHFRVRGPALIGLEAAFWGNWLEARNDRVQTLSAAPAPPPAGEAAVMILRPAASIGWNEASALFWGMCEVAERRIAITTPYFNPDVATRRALKRAADRGVEIDIVVPGPHIDTVASALLAHEAEQQLVKLGIRVWEYEPTMIHVKQILVDDDLACVGSVNLNQRSRRRDDEVALLVEDGIFPATLWRDFHNDRDRSMLVTEEVLRRRSIGRRMAAVLVRPLRHEI